MALALSKIILSSVLSFGSLKFSEEIIMRSVSQTYQKRDLQKIFVLTVDVTNQPFFDIYNRSQPKQNL